VHPLGEAKAILLVEVGEDLGVAAGREPVPAATELVPDRFVVVELAVLDRGDGSVLAEDRLMAAADVDDRKPADA
jgi:hypothetical protein